ncbi:MAG: bifunctional phosphoribosyl-AMP cyclohydrolase/phosphoribosyl-ATP diphosphatase HisIE [Buchnera aphidicola (Eriosoma harunire)]
MLLDQQLSKLNWDKVDGMLPVIVQHYISGEVLMHGYMNLLALNHTLKDKIVTFYSRTKKRLWTKGETSNNSLLVMNIKVDCDYDTILILVNPTGNVCHLNRFSCFFGVDFLPFLFLFKLEQLIRDRKKSGSINSYTFKLCNYGTKRIAQKVSEEAIELSLSAMTNDDDEFINEASDLMYHFLVLLNDRNIDLNVIVDNLKKRHINLSMS